MGAQKRIFEYMEGIPKDRYFEALAGTFQPNKEEPVHRWYNYITGFSTELVKAALEINNIKKGKTVFEPFTGVGSTQIICKKRGIESVGIDINPFITFVARTKLNWALNIRRVKEYRDKLSTHYKRDKVQEYAVPEKEPNKTLEFAFSPKIKRKLYFLRDLIDKIRDDDYRNFFSLCLVSIIKPLSNYEGFHPYLKRREIKLRDMPVFELFNEKLDIMIKDLTYIKRKYPNSTKADVFCQDVRDLTNFEQHSFDFVVTSPPYLNNWDYSWITRLELYFLKYAQTSKDIREILSSKLIKASTYNIKNEQQEIIIKDSEIKSEIQTLFENLNSKITNTKKQKRYDYLIIKYFNDIYRVFQGLFMILKEGAKIWWVVGDSGHYATHIPTGILTSKIAESVGFYYEDTKVLRERIATRHKLKLREVILILKK